MKHMTLTIGHNIGEGNRAALTHADVVNSACSVLALQGYTAYECDGAWLGRREDSTRIELYGLEDSEAERIEGSVPMLAHLLMQDSIYIDLQPDTSREVRAYSAASSATA